MRYLILLRKLFTTVSITKTTLARKRAKKTILVETKNYDEDILNLVPEGSSEHARVAWDKKITSDLYKVI